MESYNSTQGSEDADYVKTVQEALTNAADNASSMENDAKESTLGEEIPQENASEGSSETEEKEEQNAITVMVNGEQVALFGKEKYIFVDIFDRITFDLNAGGGRAIITMLNGREAQYNEEICDGDTIELYWEEN